MPYAKSTLYAAQTHSNFPSLIYSIVLSPGCILEFIRSCVQYWTAGTLEWSFTALEDLSNACPGPLIGAELVPL